MPAPKIIKGNFVPNLFSLFFRVDGVTIYPFIFVRQGVNRRLIRHESIHIEQMREMGIILFVLVYIFDYFCGMIKHRSHVRAYINIRFEQEAYKNEHDEFYILGRDPKSWRKYHV